MKKICLLIATVLLFIFSIGCVTNTAFASTSNDINFDKTNVLDDLQAMDGFKLSDYNFDTSSDRVQFLDFAEYCFSYSVKQQQNYGLYLYLFNQGDINIDAYSVLNKVQIATSYNADGTAEKFSKLDLQFLSTVTSGEHKGMFYKYKVKDTSGILATATAYRNTYGVRRYDISGVELRTVGEPNATDYLVGGTYKYAGYALGYGKDAEADTLTCERADLETLELKIKSTYYRPEGANIEGSGVQDQLNSVYFSIPNTVIEKYGTISAVTMEWYEYLTKKLVIVGNQQAYDHLKNYIGVDIGKSMNTDVKYALSTDNAFFRYNTSNTSNNLPVLEHLFSTKGALAKDFTLSAQELIKYMNEYSESRTKDINGKYSSDLFESYVDAGRTQGYTKQTISVGDNYNLINYTLNEQNIIEKIFGIKSYTSSPFNGIKAIVVVDPTDIQYLGKAEICSKYFIDGNNFDEFIKTCRSDIDNNRSTILVRSSVTNFYSHRLQQSEWEWFVFGGWVMGNVNYNAYATQQTVFLDTDVIFVDFRSDEDVVAVLPCVASPIDVVNDSTSPVNTPSEGIPFPTILLIILAVVVVVIPFIAYKSSQKGGRKAAALTLCIAGLAFIAVVVLQWFGILDFDFLQKVVEFNSTLQQWFDTVVQWFKSWGG